MSQLTVGTVVTGNASLTTQGLKLPSFTNSNRPATPNVGQIIYNTDENKAQIWNGSEWDEVGGGIPEPANITRGSYLCLLYTSPSPRDVEESRMPSSA